MQKYKENERLEIIQVSTGKKILVTVIKGELAQTDNKKYLELPLNNPDFQIKEYANS